MFRCPNKFHGELYFDPEAGHHHQTRAQVILCCHRGQDYINSIEQDAENEEFAAQQAAEIAAEMGYERMLEDRGWEEARAQEEYEMRMGVIPFDVALANARREMEAN